MALALRPVFGLGDNGLEGCGIDLGTFVLGLGLASCGLIKSLFSSSGTCPQPQCGIVKIPGK